MKTSLEWLGAIWDYIHIDIMVYSLQENEIEQLFLRLFKCSNSDIYEKSPEIHKLY